MADTTIKLSPQEACIVFRESGPEILIPQYGDDDKVPKFILDAFRCALICAPHPLPESVSKIRALIDEYMGIGKTLN